MLGSYGPWPKDDPPKIVQTMKAEAIPDEFDSRQKWPDSIHPIRNQASNLVCSQSSGVMALLSSFIAVL